MYSGKSEFNPSKLMERRGDFPSYPREGNSSNEGSSHNLGYHRSSSSSSTASSGKNLVRSQRPSHGRGHQDISYYGRHERGYNNNSNNNNNSNPREDRFFHHYPKTHIGVGRRADGLSSSSPSPSPETHKKPTKFLLGPPSSPGSSRGYHSPLRSSPSPSPELPSTPDNDRLKPNEMLHPEYNLAMHPEQMLTPPNRNSKISSIYDAYWHIPRASLWCTHKECHENQKCSQCQLKDETSSTCSSVNPPPTFTAMDNYHPVRKPQSRCSCGAIFAATTIFSTLVLLLIAAFILYVEMVLKKTQYIPDPM